MSPCAATCDPRYDVLGWGDVSVSRASDHSGVSLCILLAVYGSIFKALSTVWMPIVVWLLCFCFSCVFFFFFLPGVRARKEESIPRGNDPWAQGSLFMKSSCRVLRKSRTDWTVSFPPSGWVFWFCDIEGQGIFKILVWEKGGTFEWFLFELQPSVAR